MIRAGFFLGMLFTMVATVVLADGTSRLDLLDPALDELESTWSPRGFPLIAPTEYETRKEGEKWIVRGEAKSANRALLRKCVIENPNLARLSWQWRILQALPAGADERTRAGDDFSARVFVVFETSAIPTRTRAINYVWAAKESRDAMFPSPYTKNVGHVVVRSVAEGDGADEWVMEERDVLADYAAFFGEPASVISGVAIMVDSDNTDETAEAEFKELFLEISSADEVSCP